MTTAAKKTILIVRGDLVSNSGYSRALRAHTVALKKQFDEVYGVELHPNPNDCSAPFPGGIIQDHQVNEYSENHSVTILNYCLPELFIRIPAASKNIGLFYWETDRFNPSHNWDSYINLMDEIWIPSEFNRSLVQGVGFRGPIKYFPWPLSFDPLCPRDLATKGFSFDAPVTWSNRIHRIWNQACDSLALPNVFKRIFTRFFKNGLSFYYNQELLRFVAKYDLVFLNILQTSARKGFCLTISEWFEFIESNPSSNAGLILKLNPLRHDINPVTFLLEVQAEISRIANSFKLTSYNIFVITHKLSDAQIEGLYSKSSAVISTTLGEGFGGPMAEAIVREIPVIIPRHSSLADLIEPNYPLIIESESVNVSLAQQLSFYSLSSTWGLVKPGSLRLKLETFAKLPKSSQSELGNQAQNAFIDRLRKSIGEFQ